MLLNVVSLTMDFTREGNLATTVLNYLSAARPKHHIRRHWANSGRAFDLFLTAAFAPLPADRRYADDRPELAGSSLWRGSCEWLKWGEFEPLSN